MEYTLNQDTSLEIKIIRGGVLLYLLLYKNVITPWLRNFRVGYQLSLYKCEPVFEGLQNKRYLVKIMHVRIYYNIIDTFWQAIDWAMILYPVNNSIINESFVSSHSK